MLNASRSSSPTQCDQMVGCWVQLRQQKMDSSSHPSAISSSTRSSNSFDAHTQKPHHHERRIKSALATSPYKQHQPVESLTVSFAKLLVNQINGTSTVFSKPKKKKKKKSTSRPNSAKSNIRNNKPVIEIDHIEEWLQQRSPHYAWWRNKATKSRRVAPAIAGNLRSPCESSSAKQSSFTINKSLPTHTISKPPRCILWFVFTGNPSKQRPSSCNTNRVDPPRQHSIRIEQQPLGGNNALVFAAELQIGEHFAIVSRRQPGFTFSLTFFIDGVRHARLSGCCESARNLHVPTRVGGPIGAFVLKTVQGGTQCQICENSTHFAHPELFTVRPKSFHQSRSLLNTSRDSGAGHDIRPLAKRSALKRAIKAPSPPDEQPSPAYTSPGETPEPTIDLAGESVSASIEENSGLNNTFPDSESTISHRAHFNE